MSLGDPAQPMGDPGEILGNGDIGEIGAALFLGDGAKQAGVQLAGLVAPGVFGGVGGWGEDHAARQGVVEEERRLGGLAGATAWAARHVQLAAQQRLDRRWLLLGIKDQPDRCREVGTACGACLLGLLLVGDGHRTCGSPKVTDRKLVLFYHAPVGTVEWA